MDSKGFSRISSRFFDVFQRFSKNFHRFSSTFRLFEGVFQDPERPETPLVVPSEPSSEEEQPLEEPVRLAKTVATPKARPAEQVKVRPEVKEMERPKVQDAFIT